MVDWTKGEFLVSCDPEKQNLKVIHEFLSNSYWSKGIPVDTVERSLRESLCFSLFHGDAQVGFARVISDYATIAYLGDVFVLPEYRGRGLSKWLMDCVVSHPDLQGMRRWILATADAHGLYEQYGFTPLQQPDVFMERHDPKVYSNDA